MRRTLPAVLAIVIMTLAAAPGWSQGPLPLPDENHYLVYRIADPLFLNVPFIAFRDQWMEWSGPQDMLFEKFANPLFRKNGEDVTFDPRVHHTWWRLSPIPGSGGRDIVVQHQFGTFGIKVGEAIYLLNPADKDDQIQPPEDWPRWANHYLCYQIVEGEPLSRSLLMDDQWGPHQNYALDPYCFCNPVEKIDPSGLSYPIVDDKAHLTCYRIDPFPSGRSFSWDDQFERGVNYALDECLICLPSLKDEALPTEKTSWGRIKALFGEE